jgi:hypothetical protein
MLFTREGKEFTGTPSMNTKGQPTHTVKTMCDRCHVINGQRLWIMGIENGRAYSKTGFTCYTCGNTGIRSTRQDRLYTAEALVKMNLSADKRAAAKAITDKLAADYAAAEREIKNAAFNNLNAGFLATLETLDGSFWTGFKESFVARATAPTERQIALVEGEVAKRAANATSAFVGAVGDKIEVKLVVERVISFQTQFGTNWITLARDAQGNVFSYRGTVSLGSAGESTTVKATIKEHTVYNGVAQTVIQRPKVLD